MIRALLLHSLAKLADGAVEEGVIRELDPLARSRVRSGIGKWIGKATLETDLMDDAHLHRVAYLLLAGAPSMNWNDEREVEAQFAARRTARAPALMSSRVTLAVIAVVLSVACVVSAALVVSFLAKRLPPPTGAYVSGGVPRAGNANLRILFADALPKWLIAVDHARVAGTGATLSAAVEELIEQRTALDVAIRAANEPRVAVALTALITHAQNEISKPFDASAAEQFVELLDRVDAELAAANLGFYLDGDLMPQRDGTNQVFIASFAVSKVTVFTEDARTYRALELRRIDQLNFRHALLGFTRPGHPSALVLLDAIDEALLASIAPALGAQGHAEIVDDESAGSEWATRVTAAATEDVRASVLGARGDANRSEMIDALIARQSLVRTWGQLLAQLGSNTRPIMPRHYDLDARAYAGIGRVLGAEQMANLETLQNKLDEPSKREAYGAWIAPLVASVSRHEVQHRYDDDRDTLGRPPAALASLAPGATVDALQPAYAELSAYLSELARDPSLAKLNLVYLLRFVFDLGLAGTRECYAALATLDALAAEARVPNRTALVVNGAVAREEAARLYLALRAMPDATLASLAKKTWERLLGRPLPALRH
jgi:hypothetical protein